MNSPQDKPFANRRVAILSSQEWPGLYLTRQVIRSGVNVVGIIIANELLDGLPCNFNRWKLVRRTVGLKMATRALVGFRFGMRYALQGILRPDDFPTLDGIRRTGARIIRVKDFKSQECVDQLANLAPDVSVICGTPILPQAVLNAARVCTLNMHTSLLPHYRGGGSLFWPLFFRDSEKIGYTIHKAVAAVDAGPYLHQARVEVAPEDTGHTLIRKCFEQGVPQLIRILLEDPLDESSFKQYERPIAYAFCKPLPPVKRYLEDAGPTRMAVGLAKWVTKRVYPPIPRRHCAHKFAVFSFHRILSDDISPRDWRRILGAPTVSEVRQKLAYLKRRFEVVSVTRAVELLTAGNSLDRDYAALTVDDGYADFLTNLLPVLKEQAVPASLFVCTKAVASGTIWYQRVYNLIESIQSDRVHVPWMETDLFFGDSEHRILTIEHVILSHLKKLSPHARQSDLESLLLANGGKMFVSPSDRFCDIEELIELKNSPLVELHLHSHRHDPFESLTDEELRSDLFECREFFQAKLGLQSSIITYPNGRFSRRQAPLLRECGITAGFLNVCGETEVAPIANPLAIRRLGLGRGPIREFIWDVERAMNRSSKAIHL